MTLSEIQALRQRGQHEEACNAAAQLAAALPDDGLVQYEAACLHDSLGREAEAVNYYVQAIHTGLPDTELRGAYLGLGSTYRTLGRYQEALAVFDQGLFAFPDAREMIVFKAMTEHNLGHSKAAVEALLRVIVETSNDPHIQAYARAIEVYAQDVESISP